MTPARPLASVTTGVWVATSRHYSTTSTIVASGDKALLVDPAWVAEELTGLGEAIRELGLRVSSGFSTHAHHDHLLWHPAYGDPPRWATARTVEVAAANAESLRRNLGEALAEVVGEVFAKVRPLAGDRLPEPFGPDGPAEEIEVIVHDGHAPGHGALWLPERGLLIAADMLSDLEMPLPFGPDDLPAYLAALDILAPYVERARFLIPGHGAPTDRPIERLDADRRLLDALLAGRDLDDPRRGGHGGEETYQRLKSLAAVQGSSV